MNMRFAIHPDGFVVSFWKGEVYWPILDFEGMKVENHYEMKYNWEKCSISHITNREYLSLKFTKKIPLEWKNFHRNLWGFRAVKANRWSN